MHIYFQYPRYRYRWCSSPKPCGLYRMVHKAFGQAPARCRLGSLLSCYRPNPSSLARSNSSFRKSKYSNRGTNNSFHGADNSSYGMVNSFNGTDNSSYGMANSSHSTDNSSCGTINSRQGTDNSSCGTISSIQGTENSFGRIVCGYPRAGKRYFCYIEGILTNTTNLC